MRTQKYQQNQIIPNKHIDDRQGRGGDCPKTQNPNLKVEDKANDMESCESKVDLINGCHAGLEQKVGTTDQDKIVFGHSGGGRYDPSLSILRIMATWAVVFIHTCTVVADHPEIYLQNGTQTLFYNRLAAMMCWAVPCFMMMTGALLLKKDKKITVRICLTKYARRVVLALFLFGVPFSLLTILFETKGLALRNIWDAFRAVLQNQSWDPLWYLYALTGAYLLMPVLKKFTDHCSQGELLYVCGLLFCFDCLIPVVNAALDIEVAFSVWLPLKPCFYILAGHYFSEYPPNVKPWMAAAGAVVALVTIWIITGYGTDGFIFAVRGCFEVFASSAIFVLSITSCITLRQKSQPILWRIDRLCFGVYLVHPVFIHLMYRFFHISPIYFGSSLMVTVLFSIGFTDASFFASWLMSLVKPLKKYVL